MKFTELPKFKTVQWSSNVSLRGLKSWLGEQGDYCGLEMNPDFQRGHVWTEEQQIKYVEFFLMGGKSARDIYFNCAAWGRDETKGVPLQCVDGLQRMTALLKFLDNKLPVFDGNYLNDFEEPLRMVDNTLLIHVNNLVTKREVLQWYRELNWGGTPHAESEMKRIQKMIDEEV